MQQSQQVSNKSNIIDVVVNGSIVLFVIAFLAMVVISNNTHKMVQVPSGISFILLIYFFALCVWKHSRAEKNHLSFGAFATGLIAFCFLLALFR